MLKRVDTTYELICKTMSDILPDDVVIYIISRLPVKSLLRFQLASKPWLSLISSPDFATLQYNACENRPPKKYSL